jgi:hypothetical protein
MLVILIIDCVKKPQSGIGALVRALVLVVVEMRRTEDLRPLILAMLSLKTSQTWKREEYG